MSKKPIKSLSKLSIDELQERLTPFFNKIAQYKIDKEVDDRKKEIKVAIKYLSLGLSISITLFGGFAWGLVNQFPEHIVEILLKSQTVKTEIFNVVKEEFITGKDVAFRDAIINDDAKKRIGSEIVNSQIKPLNLEDFPNIKKYLEKNTLGSLTNSENKTDKVDAFLDGNVFINALEDKYYEKVLVFYEGATRIDHKEQIEILKKRGNQASPVNIQGLGMSLNGNFSTCSNIEIDHKKKQAILVLPNMEKLRKKHPNIKLYAGSSPISYVKCPSSVFPYETLKIKVRGKGEVGGIELAGVEISNKDVYFDPLLRITKKLSEELGLKNSSPSNKVKSFGSLFLDKVSYE